MLEILNRFARLASARSEVVGASLIILMVAMMVIPLSPIALDVLLALNISSSIVLVISAVLIQTPLAFSSFPAILLMTTLFRLSLTISTTRQILLEAEAGTIIQTFGEFVVGGNVAVGLTIFLIILIVNFLVITKGSERVAEVAARFSLDGMPGKQMSIDSDLRAGLITQAIAKQRRADLEKESQLFGAMDGAIKFVKNDAIASLVITVVNLLGGLTVGMLQKGMDFGTAASIYTILTVGDGLVSVIPSLLVSIAAGLIVTRVTKGEADGANAAQDMFRDLFGNSNALQISGIFCILFAFVPGMPSSVFVLTGGGLLVAWLFASRKADPSEQGKTAQQFERLLQQDPTGKSLQDVVHTETFPALQVRLPPDLEPTTANLVQNICRAARNRLVDHLGIMLPLFEFAQHDKPFVELHVYGVPAMTISMSDKRLAIQHSMEEIKTAGVEDVCREMNRITGHIEFLCEPVYKPQLDQAGLTYLNFENRLMHRVQAILVQKIHQLFTLNEYQKHVSGLGEHYSEQLKELDRVMPITKIVDVVQRLLAESVSIKNMRSILNSLIEWGQRERDAIIIAEQVRRGLHEQICHQHGEDRRMDVFMLSTEFEQVLRESNRNDGTNLYMDIDASALNEMIDLVRKQCEDHLHKERVPAVVCSLDCRPFFRQLIQDSLFCIPVLSHQEISSSFEVRVLGSIEIELDQNSSPIQRGYSQ